MLQSNDRSWYQTQGNQPHSYNLSFNKNLQQPGNPHVSQSSPHYEQYHQQVNWSLPSQIDPRTAQREVIRNVPHPPWSSPYAGYENLGPSSIPRNTTNEQLLTQYEEFLMSSQAKNLGGNYDPQRYNLPEVQNRTLANVPRIRVRDVFSVNSLVDKETLVRRNEVGSHYVNNDSNVYQPSFQNLQEPPTSLFQYPGMNTVSWRPRRIFCDPNTRLESCVTSNSNYLNQTVAPPNKSVGNGVDQYENYQRPCVNQTLQKNNPPLLSHSFAPVTQATNNVTQFQLRNNIGDIINSIPQSNSRASIPRSHENNVTNLSNITSTNVKTLESGTKSAGTNQLNNEPVNSVWKVVTPESDCISNQNKSNEKAVSETSLQSKECRIKELLLEKNSCTKSLPDVSKNVSKEVVNKNLIEIKFEEDVSSEPSSSKEEKKHKPEADMSKNYKPKINREKLGLLIEFLEGSNKTESMSKRKPSQSSPDYKENVEKNVKENNQIRKHKTVGNGESLKQTTPKKDVVVEDKRSEECAQGLTKIVATPAEAKMIHDMRLIRKSESHFCKRCNLKSPNGSFWINPVSGKVKCLSCFKKSNTKGESSAEKSSSSQKHKENKEKDERPRKRLFSSNEDHVENVNKKAKLEEKEGKKEDLKDKSKAKKPHLNKTKAKVKDDNKVLQTKDKRKSVDEKDRKKMEPAGTSGRNSSGSKDLEAGNRRKKLMRELYKRTREVSLVLLREH